MNSRIISYSSPMYDPAIAISPFHMVRMVFSPGSARCTSWARALRPGVLARILCAKKNHAVHHHKTARTRSCSRWLHRAESELLAHSAADPQFSTQPDGSALKVHHTSIHMVLPTDFCGVASLFMINEGTANNRALKYGSCDRFKMIYI